MYNLYYYCVYNFFLFNIQYNKLNCKGKKVIVHIFDINFEVNLNLLHFHTVFWIIMFVTCTFLLWYNVYFIICIQIKDYLMQNLYNCIATLCLSRVYHHRVYTWFIYENWKCNTDFIFIDTYKNIHVHTKYTNVFK